MDIKKTFGKIQALFNNQNVQGRKMTPNEVELASFKERERLDNVKKELSHYRKKDVQELLIGHKIETGSTIIAQKMNLLNRHKNKEKCLLNNTNYFIK